MVLIKAGGGTTPCVVILHLSLHNYDEAVGFNLLLLIVHYSSSTPPSHKVNYTKKLRKTPWKLLGDLFPFELAESKSFPLLG